MSRISKNLFVYIVTRKLPKKNLDNYLKQQIVTKESKMDKMDWYSDYEKM